MKMSTSLRRGAAALVVAAAVVPAVATASFATGPSAPAAPVANALVSGNRFLAVSWTESSTGAISFKATATSAGKPSRSCVTHALGCHVPALINGVVYVVSVTATNAGGKSPASNAVSSFVGVATAPLSVHATAAKASAVVFWAPPIASGVSGITGYVATAEPGGSSCPTTGTLLNPPARTCVIPLLTSGVKYTITVVAQNAYGFSPPSKQTSVTAL
jgi:hypothetical protein